MESYVTLDYHRSERTGFPEVVFAQGKTSQQVCQILDDLASKVNERIILSKQQQQEKNNNNNINNVNESDDDDNNNNANTLSIVSNAVLATR